MSERRIDELWAIAYENGYLSLPREARIGGVRVTRNEMAQAWLNSLSLRPHIRFARLIEAELAVSR